MNTTFDLFQGKPRATLRIICTPMNREFADILSFLALYLLSTSLLDLGALALVSHVSLVIPYPSMVSSSSLEGQSIMAQS